MSSYFKTLLAVLLLLPAFLCAQTITGKVTDDATGAPMENVSVYFDGTSVGTVTDGSGNFSLKNNLNSSAPLVLSYMGYQTHTIKDFDNGSLNLALKTKAIVLKEITVTSDKISRPRAMRIFMNEFIGANNGDCVINNPEVIYFNYNKAENLLTAYADKPLLITNKVLGYKITYALAEFSRTPLKTQYKGNYFFTEDTAGLKPERLAKIHNARRDAYFGSRMHFIRSLWANDLERNYFSLYKSVKGNIDYSLTYRLDERNKLLHDDIVISAEGKKYIMMAKNADANDKRFADNEIFITYRRGSQSYILQENANRGVVIDKNGFYDEGIEWKRTMGSYRVNRLLPYEFVPEI